MPRSYLALILIALMFMITFVACRKDKFRSLNDEENTPTVSTVAGTGNAGYKDGSGSSAEFYLTQYIRNAEFSFPSGVATDADGNVYVTDDGNRLIRKITPDGEVSTVTDGYITADNVWERVFNPRDVATDAAGNIYFSEDVAPAIIKIPPLGFATIFAGGRHGFNDGAGTNAEFRFVKGVATDASGNVYVADSENNRIRKITPSGNVSTLAGDGIEGADDGVGTSARFDRPVDVTTDAQGNVYVADFNNNAIRQITPDRTVTTYAYFERPAAVATDADGNVYVSTNNQIGKITPEGQVTILAGNDNSGYANGQGSVAKFDTPLGLATDHQGNVYVADEFNNRIRKITPSGEVSNFAGNGVAGYVDNVNASPQTNSPAGIAIDFQGNLFVADVSNHRIRKISPSGDVSTFAGNTEEGFLDGKGTSAKFFWPTGIATDLSGNVFVADSRNNRIRKITPDGIVTTIAGNGMQGYRDAQSGFESQFNNPVAVTTDAYGNLYVADAGNHCIRRISPMGDVSTVAGNGEEGIVFDFKDAIGTAARFASPWGIAADAKGNLYVADAACHCIRKISTTAQVTMVAGDLNQNFYSVLPGFHNGNGNISRFDTPAGLCVDDKGNILVADARNNCIRIITPVGNEKYTVNTLIGTTDPGFVDGDEAHSLFKFPAGITIDAQGNIYVADAGNHSIRKIVMKK